MKTTDTACYDAVCAETFDDIIFDGRNLKYGAYNLRKTYNKSISISLLATIVVALIIAWLALFRPPNTPPEIKQIIDYGPSIPVSPDYIKPFIPPQVKMDEIIKTQKAANNGPMVIVDRETENTQVATQEELVDQSKTPPSEGNGSSLVPTPSPVDDVFEKEQGYEKFEVNEQASFRNGTVDDFRVWLGKNISYPEEAVTNEIKGMVVVKFAVGKDGKICDVVVEKSIHPVIDGAVVKTLLSSPEWKPAKKNGKPVKVFYHVPVMFNLIR
jgi:protein TonB